MNKQPYRYSQLVVLVLPIAFTQFMNTLVSACDALMLGQLAQNAMAAVSLAGQVAFVQSLFTGSMATGTSMFAAQYWGKGDRASVEKVFGITWRVSVFVGMLFSIACFCAPDAFMHILTNDPELLAIGSEYLRYVSISYVLTSASQLYLCIMKNSEQIRLAATISSLAVIVNIVGNAILIFGLLGAPRLGTRGAAYATVIAKLFEYLFVKLNSLRKSSIPLRLHFVLHPDRALKRQIWKRTLPALGNSLVWGLGFSMSTVIIGHLGAAMVAANSIAAIVRNLMTCFCNGLSNGGGILVGNELGAGRLDRGRALGDMIMRLALWSGLAVSGCILLFIPAIRLGVSLDPLADHYLMWMLIFNSVWMLGKTLTSVTMGGIFPAGGDSKFGFLCDAIALWGIVVPLGLLAAFVWHLPVLVVYCIVIMDEIIKVPVILYHYKKYQWVKDLT